MRGYSNSNAAAALHHLMVSQGCWVPEVKYERFKQSLREALNSYAALQVKCDDPQQLGLPAEAIVDCCGVCSQGHMGFLEARGAAHLQGGVPDRGPLQHLAAQPADAAGPAAAAAAQPSQHQQPPLPQQQRNDQDQQPQQPSQQQQQQQQQPQDQ